MNLITLVSRTTGLTFREASRNSGEFVGPCPFCKEGVDRFHIFTRNRKNGKERFWCRVCNASGDAIEFLMRHDSITFRDAVAVLEREGYHLDIRNKPSPQPVSYPPPSLADCKRVHVNHREVLRWHETGKQKAYDYYKQWGLTPAAIESHCIGWRAGSSCGYTIPHYWLQNGVYYVKGVKIRCARPDSSAKFYAVPSSNLGGVWNPKWVSNPDGSRLGPQLEYCLITEAEKDAALLETLGYPAISYLPERHWNAHLRAVFRNVVQPIIVADADERGFERACFLRQALRADVPVISTARFGTKQVSDLVKLYGAQAAHRWLERTGFDLERIPCL